MRLLPRRLFGRLVLGLVTVSLCAIGMATSYLYLRFHNAHSFFYEGTLQSFASDIAKQVTFADGAISANIDPSTTERLAQSGSRFVVLDAAGKRLAGSPDAREGFISTNDAGWRYFWLPKTASRPELFGLSERVPDAPFMAFVQVVVPIGHTLLESILHEFINDIAWLWLPFVFLVLLTNVLVVRLALRPLAATVEEARAIQPGGVAVTLTEKGLPEDILALVRTVNEAFGRLRQAFRAQEEFVADMAHELRTPIAVMKAQLAAAAPPYARLLESDLGGMERLVDQLLDRARLGKFHIEPGDVVDLQEVACEVSTFLAPRIIGRGCSIEVVAREGEGVRVAGGHDDLFRALRNLIENALEYSPPHGLIRVEVTDDPAIVVTDRGPGFPPNVLDAELRRNGSLRSDRREGAGLGLSIVERTMSAHGGELILSNEPGAGGRAEMRFRTLHAR